MIIASDNLLALGLFILPTYQVCVFMQVKIELVRVYVVYRILLQLCLCLHTYYCHKWSVSCGVCCMGGERGEREKEGERERKRVRERERG